MKTHHKLPHTLILGSLSCLLLSLTLFQTNQTIIMEWTILSINSTSLSLPILLDPTSTIFMFTVMFISFNVMLFAKTYMLGDPHLQRFSHLVMAFIASMICLITSPNMITMLLGWDGLGITSFLLVIYYQNNKSLKSGFITLTSNRIGDCLILLAITLTMSQGQWNSMNMWSNTITSPSLTTSLILLAAMTKSAQFPFSAWLTCAMAAPTPVSALVHSSTLVTAGVYILIRFYSFLSEFPLFNATLMITGSFTMCIPAAWAMTKKDLKETIALSTMSQLGLMMVTLSMGMTNLCFFHLLTHAMFKANIFMGAGVMIMFKEHRQNFTNIFMKLSSRTTGISMALSMLSMNAMFYLAGYYSKDLILEMAWYSPSLYMVMTMYLASTVLTAVYTTRIYRAAVTTKVYRRTFFRKNMPHTLVKQHIVNNSFNILEVPMTLMMTASLTVGATLFWLLMNPSDTTIIIPREIQNMPPILTAYGAMIAATFCPSNKAKTFNRTLEKWNYKYVSKFMRMSKAHNPNNSNNMLWHKTPTWTYTKLVNYNKTPMPSSSNYSKTNFKSCNAMKTSTAGLPKMKLKPANVHVSLFYKLALPMLKLPITIEKSLDQGALMILGPASSSSVISMNKAMLKYQSSLTNQMLIVMLVSTVLLFPLMI